MARPKNTVQSDNPTHVKILEEEIERLKKELEEPQDQRLVEVQEKCKNLMNRLDLTRESLNLAVQLLAIREKRLRARGGEILELREKDQELSVRFKEAIGKVGF